MNAPASVRNLHTSSLAQVCRDAIMADAIAKARIPFAGEDEAHALDAGALDRRDVMLAAFAADGVDVDALRRIL